MAATSGVAVTMLHLVFCLALAAQSVSQVDLAGLERALAATDREPARRLAADLMARAYDQPKALLALGQLLGARQEYSLAEQALRRAAERQPESFEANFLLGVVLSETGKTDDAIRRLRAAQQLRPAHPGLPTVLGALYLRGGYSQDAAEVLQRAVEIDSANQNAGLLLAEAHHQNFDLDKALDLARTLAARFTGSANAQFRLGYELETGGQFEEAAGAYRRALVLQPAHPEAALALGRIQLRSGRHAEAVKLLETAARPGPVNRTARIELAKALLAARQGARARALLAVLVTEQPDDALPHLLLSQVHHAEGDTEMSRKEREIYLELARRATEGGMSGNLAARRTKRFPP